MDALRYYNLKDANDRLVNNRLHHSSDRSTWVKSYYVRHASGYLMATYARRAVENNLDSVYYELMEQFIYSSSHLRVYSSQGQRQSGVIKGNFQNFDCEGGLEQHQKEIKETTIPKAVLREKRPL